MALRPDVVNAIASDQELSDTHINLFLELLTRHTCFKPQNVLFYELPSAYQSVFADDIEILYDGNVGERSIGHYTCVKYSYEEKKVFIYDSSGRNCLGKEHVRIIEQLYPDKNEIIFKNVVPQPDNKSCGLFAIAFATSLALQRDPVNEIYSLGKGNSTITMRLHLISMLENDSLMPFPTTPLSLTKKRGRPKKEKVGRPPTFTDNEKVFRHRESVTKYQTQNLEKHKKMVSKFQKKNPENHRKNVIKHQKSNKTEVARKVAKHRLKKICNLQSNEISTFSLKNSKLGENSCECKVCGSKFFVEEMTRKEWCCGQGKYYLGNLPPLLDEFYTKKEFLDSARIYNNLFAFSSLGVSGEFLKDHNYGPSLVKIQGRTYHLLCNLNNDGPINNVVLYIDDGSMRSKKADDLKVNKSIFDSIQKYLNGVSPVVPLLKKLSDCPAEKARILFEDTSRSTHGPVLGDKPKIEELAGILKFDDSSEPRQVVIWKKGDSKPSSVSIFSPAYESLQYPLLFPHGTFGWYPGLVSQKNFKISQTKYYRLQLLSDCDNRFSGFKRLSQEYFVDMWSRAEEEKLLWVKREQAKILRMATRDEFDETVVGQNGIPIGRVYLPNTFTNSPRNMQIKYMDAMAIVTRLGRPSFFITMTCNPKWPEITSNLRKFETSIDRPDLCNRVFQLKLLKLLQILRSGELFGKMISLLWVIEFQKRGLPHAHIALRVEGGGPTDPKSIDEFVKADFPIQDEELCNLVVKHMIHGPCGPNMRKTPCYDISTHKCTRNFPKKFNEQTYIDDSGYVHYKRPQGVSVKKNKDIDTTWVVPYNPKLLIIFNCHINVEIASSVKVVKYLFKYIHKGPDKAKVAVTDKENVDEIEEYVSLRYISASEAIWRILEFDMSGRTPAVNSLPLHLPNKDTIIFEPGKEDKAKKLSISKLCLYFLRPKNYEMSELTYLDFYEKFIVHTTKPKSESIALGSKRHWITKRKRGECVARLHWISPSLGELFYLRLLLSKFPAYNFEELRTVNNEVFESFQEAAEARGLIDQNENFIATMQEAIGFMLGSGLRQVFVCLIVVGAPAKLLWETFKEQLAEDFLSKSNSSHPDALNKALLEIDRKLRLHGKSCQDTGLPKPSSTDTEVDREILKWDTVVCEELLDEWLPKLTREQMNVFEKLCLHFSSDISQRVFFLDGPGGSGKTTLIKIISAYYRSKKQIVLCTASTGVAALNYDGGVTAHSMFKLPLNTETEKYCSLSSTSQRAELLRSATLIVWDEASMARKEQIEILDRTLQDFMGNKKCFGGKLMLFAGDFRQIPPVIKYGTAQDVIFASMKNSFLWPRIQTLHLTQSQRSIRDLQYSSYIMKVGNGAIHGEKCDENAKESFAKFIRLSYIKTVSTLEELITWVFPSDILQNRIQCLHRAILSGTNSNIDQINELVLNQLPGSIIEVFSSDSLKMTDDSKKKNSNETNFYNDLLNTFSEPGVPNHKLRLKVGCQCLVMRNLSFDDGLVNGSKVYIDRIGKHIIEASLFDEKSKGFRTVCIPRIPFVFTAGPNGMEIVRKQFPLRLSYGLTINKSQGQTLDMVGVDLRSDVFCHGQLYVALSRVRSRATIKVLLPHHRYFDGEPNVVNIVYKILLR